MTARRGVAVQRAAVVLVALATVLLVLLAGSASGHAVLVSTSPQDGADLDAPPARVELTFNEPVEVTSDALRVFDADAVRVDGGLVDGDVPEVVAVALPDDLPDGGYVVTYRVISADSHPIAGVLTFTVGGAAAVDDAVVAELFGGAGATATGLLGPLLRGLGYVATLLAAGMVAIATLVARNDGHRRTARAVAVRAAVAGGVLSLLAVPVQGAATAGIGMLEAATSTQVLGEVVDTGFGEGTVVRVLALVVLAALWRRPSPALLVGLAAGAALGSYLRDGHQRTVEPAWVMIGGDAIHLAAGALWLAGLVLLALVLRAAPRDANPLPVASFLARFSSVALVTVALLALSGTAMAWPLVGSFGALTSTPYGWMLVGKVSAVAVVVVLALYNRRRLAPVIVAHAAPQGGSAEVPVEADQDTARTERVDGAWRALTTTVRVEAVVLVGVLLLTGFLVSQRPAAEEAGLRGLYETSAVLGEDLEVDVLVDPNQVGRNAIHIYVVDATGRPSADVADLVVELTYLPEGIGPIVVEPLTVGPGHWTATIDDLVFPGEWELRLVAGVDRFTELSAEVVIPVAG